MIDFRYIANLKIFLRDNFYSNPSIQDEILKSIEETFDLFSVSFNGYSIELKIKKTNIKKSSDFQHTATYYYSIINALFHSLFCMHQNDIAYLMNETKPNYTFVGNEKEFIIDPYKIQLLYNITTMGDNIVIINL